MAQGIPRDKEKVIEALKPYFKLDYTVNKACDIIGIAQSTVQTWIDADDDLRLQIQAWRAEPSIKAREQWVEAIKNGRPTKFGPDVYTPSKEWLERREKDDFSTKTETDITTQGEKITTPPAMLTEILEEAKEKLKQKLSE
jgi:hypothetical protein